MYRLIGIIIFLLTLVLIIVRPYRISEAKTVLCGAILMLCMSFLSPWEALTVLKSKWNVFGFFLGLMIISALADQAGVFETLAFRAGQWARGRAMRLYLAVFAIGVLITAFMSNDATTLILTPVVYVLVTRLRLPVLPFLFACTFIADTASFILPVSNPINVLVIDAFSSKLTSFIGYLILPSLFCILLNIGLFSWLYREELCLTYDLRSLQPPKLAEPRYFRYTLLILALISIGYIIAMLLDFPVSVIALSGSLLLLGGAWWFHCLDWQKLRGEISWSLFIFVGGMFLIVRAVENLGLTAAFGNFLVNSGTGSPFYKILLTASGTALGANLINNVPMTIVMISALSSVHAPEPLLYATILGADLGPNLTTVGSLATMLWLVILRRKGLEVSTMDYFKLGIIIVPLMILIGSLLIWLRSLGFQW